MFTLPYVGTVRVGFARKRLVPNVHALTYALCLECAFNSFCNPYPKQKALYWRLVQQTRKGELQQHILHQAVCLFCVFVWKSLDETKLWVIKAIRASPFSTMLKHVSGGKKYN